MIKSLILAASALVAVPAMAATIENFENFNPAAPAFTTDYTYTAPTAGNNSAAQQYTVAPSAFPWNPAFADYAGTDGANFMVVNGGAAGTTVWSNRTPFALVGGGRYRFSFDLSSACCNAGFGTGGQDPAPAVLAVTINGVTSLTALTASPTAGIWTNVGGDFTAAAGSQATFAIINNNGAPNGNDFGIDAIAVNGVPEPATWAMMISGFGFVGFATRRRRSVRTVTA